MCVGMGKCEAPSRSEAETRLGMFGIGRDGLTEVASEAKGSGQISDRPRDLEADAAATSRAHNPPALMKELLVDCTVLGRRGRRRRKLSNRAKKNVERRRESEWKAFGPPRNSVLLYFARILAGQRFRIESYLLLKPGMARVPLADLNGPKCTPSGQNGPFWSREC